MSDKKSESGYVLGNADLEHERLIRQARWVNPHTDRLFREAGIGSGQRVLDFGAGVGDVSLVLAAIVGPKGEVVGVERDPRSIARATARVAEAGIRNVRFTQYDVSQLPVDRLFDAAVGRYILMFLSDPVSVLRSAYELVRSGGVIAFQEPDWRAFVQDARRFPLWCTGASVLVETFRRSGVNSEMGPELPLAFARAGLPAPAVRSDVLIGAEEWMPGVLESIKGRMKEYGLRLEALGSFDTLRQRLEAEISTSQASTPLPSLLSAWCRKP